MKKYLYEDEVLARGASFSAELMSAGFDAAVEKGSVRNYVVKVVVGRGSNAMGKLRIYYKPSKKQYTLDFTELTDRSYADAIQSVWTGDKQTKITHQPVEESSACEYSAYVDGSFIHGKIGYGAVIILNNEIVEEISGECTEPDAISQRQVPGEIEAVKKVVSWCKKKKIERIEIFYDYAGLEKWAIGAWKTNNAITKAYAAFMKKSSVAVVWRKVKSHSGDRWNDHVDMLAKRGVTR
ncbi:MAG TPA: RNase H family protein [Spirochaetota bacterium]